jgi:stearoyl-CoA desaturase (delta-9 desaturase)
MSSAGQGSLEQPPSTARRLRTRELPPDATKRYDARARRIERVVLVGITGVPLLGAAAGVALLVSGRIALSDHLIFAVLYCLTGFGITIGYHRLLAHRAFRTGTALRATFAIAGAMAIQGPAMRWVADHRRHHGFTDRAGDPHSPWRSSSSEALSARGLGYAHLGWFFDADKTAVRRFAPDLLADPTVTRIDRLYPLWMVLSLAIPSALGFVVGGSQGALHGLVWGGLTRICVVQHLTWSINSIAHAFGTRPFDTPDQSRNNRLLAWLALGEGLHNNHHAFPRAAIQSLHDGEVDPSGLVLRGLERLGAVWDLHRATPPNGTGRARS